MKLIKTIVIFYIFYNSALSQWSNNPAVNLQVTDWGRNLRIASDNNGGVYIGAGRIIDDIRHHLFLLRLDENGYHAWTDTIRIAGDFGTQGELELIECDDGNVIASFIDQKYLGCNGRNNVYKYLRFLR